MVAGWPAQERAGLRGSPAASMGREDPAPRAKKGSWGTGPDGGKEQTLAGADGAGEARHSETGAGDAGHARGQES